ncbi:MAG: Holliday junction branch migration protein RuvA [Gammaproteobacteria bacterium]|nr:Holliday junction branch migration protein RuvA [Gammaproteobacteria bacterium]
MIGYLSGKIISKHPPTLLIDVNGIGYEVQCPMSTFYQLDDEQLQVTLLTHFIVREDAQLLYGFMQAHERALFRALIKVNGVGPKLALTILSGIEPEQFVACVRANDSSSLVRIPGIGKKTAERLIVEMRDALKDWQTTNSNNADPISQISAFDDAISALTALGYKNNEAQRAVNQVAGQSDNCETLIRLALQQMLKGAST